MPNVFSLPDVGEGLTEADIVTWKVAAGDSVTVNQILVEIETAKSLVELPSPQAGTVSALLVSEGDTVEVGTPIIEFGGDAAANAPQASAESAPASAPPASTDSGEPAGDEASGPNLVGYGTSPSSSRRRPRRNAVAQAPSAKDSALPPAPEAPAAPAPAQQPAAPRATGHALAKPPVRKLAKDRGIDLAEVTATGPAGDVTRDDLLRHIESTAGAQTDASAGPAVSTEATGASGAGREERIPFKGVTKFMAQAMVDSAFTAPHVTEFLDVDMTATMEFTRELKASKALGEDVRVSPLLLVAAAVSWAARRHPRINSSFDGDDIVVKHYVNLGIAAATPRGLIVPNIKNADALSLSDLARALGDLTATARSGRTSPAEQAGGTISITNVGVFGVDSGTPIINPGEAAIVAFGQVRKRPWVVDDEIVVREVSTLAVSADHRLVDGEIISKFLADLGRALEDPRLLLI